MIDKAGAARLAERKIASYDVECVLQEEATIEEPFGWVFFYQSKAYDESGDFRDMLGGNAPLVVFRDSGEVRATAQHTRLRTTSIRYETNGGRVTGNQHRLGERTSAWSTAQWPGDSPRSSAAMDPRTFGSVTLNGSFCSSTPS